MEYYAELKKSICTDVELSVTNMCEFKISKICLILYFDHNYIKIKNPKPVFLYECVYINT